MEVNSIPGEVLLKDINDDSEPVVKLPVNQDGESGLKSTHRSVEDESNSTLESMDAQDFAPVGIKAKDFEDVASENLFESTKVGRLRKFKGHKKTEDLEAQEKNIDARVQEYKDRIERGDSEEEIAADLAKQASDSDQDEESSKKAYSPNRSFMDLLEDSERRKVEKEVVSVESTWSEVDDLEDEDVLIEEGSNYKPLIYGGGMVAAAAVAGTFLFLQHNSSQTTVNDGVENDGAENEGQNQFEANGNGSLLSDPDMPNESGLTLKEEALNLLKEFHSSANHEVKSSLCRLPKRTLMNMKDYYSNVAQDYTVTDIKINPQRVIESGIEFIKAQVATELDGETSFKSVYFVRDEEGALKLDWHTYVKYEITSWKNFLNLANPEPEEWHVNIDFNGDEHPDFKEEEFLLLRVRSWNPDAIEYVNAYLSRDSLRYGQLIKAYNSEQRTFVLKLRHLNDDTDSLIVDEVISLSEFYVDDIETDVSSSIDEILIDNSSY